LGTKKRQSEGREKKIKVTPGETSAQLWGRNTRIEKNRRADVDESGGFVRDELTGRKGKGKAWTGWWKKVAIKSSRNGAPVVQGTQVNRGLSGGTASSPTTPKRPATKRQKVRNQVDGNKTGNGVKNINGRPMKKKDAPQSIEKRY